MSDIRPDCERECSTVHVAATTNGPFSQPCFYCGGPVYDGQGWIGWPTKDGRVIAHGEKRPRRSQRGLL